MRLITVLSILLIPSYALAAGGAHSGEIPTGTILQQVFNLTIVVFGLVFFLRKKISTLFAERKTQFAQLIEKAEEAKAAAEKNKREVTERLMKLESNADSDLKKAKSEAEELKAKIIAEAESLSRRLEQEAQKTAQYEIERAKLRLRKVLLEEALKASKGSLKDQVNPQIQSRLQSEFVDKLQVVQ